MSKQNRLRWICWGCGILSCLLLLFGACAKFPVAEAVGIVALFVDLFVVAVKVRCPCCNRALRVVPPLSEEEFCPYCGTKIE